MFEGATEVGSTTTANGGQYYFTNANVTGGVKFNTAYEIRIATAQGPLSILSLTTTDAGSSDLIDNDGTTSGANAIKAFTTGNAGENNHSYDFGFRTAAVCMPPTITSVSINTATCTNGVANANAEVHVTGIGNMAKYAYKTNATDSLWANTATASTATSIDLTGLANPSVATTYTFRIWGIDTTCYNDTIVVLNPKNCTTVKSCTAGLLSNNDFEQGTTPNPTAFAGGIRYDFGSGNVTGWDTATAVNRGNEYRVLSPMAASGDYFVYIYSNGTTAGGTDACLAQSGITVVPNTKYTLCVYAADAKADGKPSGVAFEIQEKRSNGANSVPFHYKVDTLPDNPNWRNGSMSLIPWTLRTYTFTTGSNTARIDLWLSAHAIDGDTSFVALDFACLQAAPIPTIVSTAVDTATCTNGVANSNAAVMVRGIINMAKYAYGTNGTTGLFAATATTSTADSIRISNLTNPASARTYTFRIYASDTTCYNDTTVILPPSVCPPCSITATFTQNPCNNNGTTAITTDDYFTISVSSVSGANVGASGKYEVVLNGTTVLNPSGTAYGVPVLVGSATTFMANGTSTYQLTARDLDMPTCITSIFTTTATTACSVIPCPLQICIPVTVTRN